ncbi:hypothetical protein IL992_28455 [Microbispora sp. NEAU-D428]|nr:hypothetical protein [Microbispora sitophila]MBE3013088.1 hypothetical protein [Microbispora sitophila]
MSTGIEVDGAFVPLAGGIGLSHTCASYGESSAATSLVLAATVSSSPSRW